MSHFTVDIEYVLATALLKTNSHDVARDILLVIDWEGRAISAETRDPEEHTTSEYRWRGREDAYTLPPLVDATRLQTWVAEEVVPRAEPLAEAYQTVYEDVEAYGRFPGHEDEKAEFDRWMAIEAAPPLHDGGLWPVEEWLAGDTCGVRPDTTDERLKAIAGGIQISADQEAVVLIGGEAAVVEHLQGLREEARASPAGLLADLRGRGVPEKRLLDLIQQGDLRCGTCCRVLEIVDSDSETVWLGCPTEGEGHTSYRIDIPPREELPRVHYEIDGYEMLEKTVTASGSSGHAPLPKKWIGHRVKIVRID